MCIEIPAHIIYISLGPPDPPSDLEYGDSVVIETSVNLEWRRPSYTGGVPVMNYSVTASSSGGTLSVSDDSERVSYTTPRLVYGDIEVTAINYCGQQSQPASLNILAEGWLSNLVCHILLGVGKGIYLVSYYVGERKRANIVVQLARYFSTGPVTCRNVLRITTNEITRSGSAHYHAFMPVVYVLVQPVSSSPTSSWCGLGPSVRTC